jgi:glyoxylase-like metal-dependent hydrolase (beta-lactamase superfamily II)
MTLFMERIPVGPIGTICYTISDPKGEAVIIDPGAEPEKILNRLHDKKWVPVAILLTHGHYDHIEGIAAIKAAFPVPVIGSEDDLFLLDGLSQSGFVGHKMSPVTLDQVVKDGQTLMLLNTAWRVISTPGHTPGSLTYVTGNWAFTGDTLFALGSVGRTDLWRGSADQIKHSIFKKLFALPDSTQIFPGHGNHSTIGQEKAIHQLHK